MKIEILPSARDDLSTGFWFYEKQEKGLGSYFLDSLFSDIDSLHLYAGIHPHILGFQRMLARRFPFAVYYRLEGDSVRIAAVLDCRRNPDWIQGKLT